MPHLPRVRPKQIDRSGHSITFQGTNNTIVLHLNYIISYCVYIYGVGWQYGKLLPPVSQNLLSVNVTGITP